MAAQGDIAVHETARARRRREKPNIDLNLTSMIDVTFLLLVYFMVATQFRLGEEVYRLDLPDRQPSQSTADPFELDDEPLKVRVATTGIRPGDYRVRLEGPYPQPRTFGELEEYLVQQRIGDASPGGLFAADHPVVVLPSAETSWQHALEAFNAAVRADYSNVTLGAP